MEVGVIATARWQKMINGAELGFFHRKSWVIGIEELFSDKVSVPTASQLAGWPHSPHSPHLVRKKSSIPKSQDLLEKINNFEPLIILWHLIGAITPTSILIFIALFDCGLQKLIYIDLMQVL